MLANYCNTPKPETTQEFVTDGERMYWIEKDSESINRVVNKMKEKELQKEQLKQYYATSK